MKIPAQECSPPCQWEHQAAMEIAAANGNASPLTNGNSSQWEHQAARKQQPNRKKQPKGTPSSNGNSSPRAQGEHWQGAGIPIVLFYISPWYFPITSFLLTLLFILSISLSLLPILLFYLLFFSFCLLFLSLFYYFSSLLLLIFTLFCSFYKSWQALFKLFLTSTATSTHP